MSAQRVREFRERQKAAGLVEFRMWVTAAELAALNKFKRDCEDLRNGRTPGNTTSR